MRFLSDSPCTFSIITPTFQKTDSCDALFNAELYHIEKDSNTEYQHMSGLYTETDVSMSRGSVKSY
jgi:hypothetical protein